LVLFLSLFQNSDPRVGDPKPALKNGTQNQKLEVNSKSSSSSLSFKIKILGWEPETGCQELDPEPAAGGHF
jgi:hypothetical protein